jgi:gliding motility-associated-like protein
MKRLFPVFMLYLLVTGCKKNKEATAPINCNGLITDTLGTGDNGRVYMPNAFTPNSDGLNDLSRPITQNIASLTFTVYDSLNNVIFTTSSAPYSWATTATNNSASTFYFRIQATTNNNHHIGLCGKLYRLACVPAWLQRSKLYFEDQLTPFGFTGTTSEGIPDCP